MRRLWMVLAVGLIMMILVAASGEAVAQRQVSVPALSGVAGANIVIPINIDDPSGIAGADIRLTFEPGILALRTPPAQVTTLTTGFTLVTNPSAGQIIISMARANGIPQGTPGGVFVEVLATVNAVPNPCTTPLTLQSVSLFDEMANTIPSVRQNGSFTACDSSRELTIGDVSGYPGDCNVIIPISIDNAEGIAGADIRVCYDPAIITTTEVRTTPLTAGFSLVSNISPPCVNISMASANPIPSGNGALVELVACISPSAPPETYPLDLQSCAVFDVGGSPVSSSCNDGSVIVNPPQVCSISGTVTLNLGDLTQVTLTLSGTASRTTHSAANGSYSFDNLAPGNYTVTPSLTGCSFTPPSRTYTPLNSNQTGQDFTGDCIAPPRALSVGNATGCPGDTCIVVPISINDAADIAGFDICLTFNPDIITLSNEPNCQPPVRTIALTTGFSLVYNDSTPGQVCISAARASGISGGSGALVEVLFDVNPSAAFGSTSPLTLQNVSLFDESANPITPITIQNGVFTVCSGERIIDIPELEALPGSTIDVPVTINNAEDIVAVTDLTISWCSEPAMLQLQDVLTSSCTSAFNLTYNQEGHQVRVTLYGTNPLPAGPCDLFVLRFLVDPGAAPGQCCPLDNQCGLIETQEGPIPVACTDGEVCIPLVYDVSGFVRYFATGQTCAADTNKPLAGAQLAVAGPDARIVASDCSGHYEALDLISGNYTFTPQKSDQTGGITGLDASFIAQYTVGMRPLNECQRTAADVNGSNTITGLDASMIAQYTVGLRSLPFPCGVHWKFTPANRSYTPLIADHENEDYVAMVMGDVNGSWQPPACPGSNPGTPLEQSAPVVQAGVQTVVVSLPDDCPAGPTSEDIAVPVHVTGATGVIAVTNLTILYDATKIYALSVTKTVYTTDFTVTPNLETLGEVRVTLYSTTALSEDEGDLLNITFHVIGQPGDCSALDLTEGLFETESEALPVEFDDGRFCVGPETVTITSGPSGAPNPVASEGIVNCSVTAADSCDHTLTYLWSATGGSFDNPTAQYPVWTSPVNATCAAALHTISVTARCYENPTVSDFDFFDQTVSAAVTDTVTITSGPSGNPNPVASGGTVNCSVTGEDSCQHALAYLWSAPDGSFNDPTAQNPVWTAPANPTCAATLRAISVTIRCYENPNVFDFDSFDQTVSGAVTDTVTITSGPSGNPDPVASGGDVNLSVTANDACGHALNYQWSPTCGSFDNPTSPNPVWTAPVNSTDAIQYCDITVTVTCSENPAESDTGTYSQGIEPGGPTELHVDAANTCPGIGTVNDPFCSIQPAIDDAEDGCTIIVHDGVYSGLGNQDIDFGGKAITLRSANGPANTIIDCQGNGRGLYFHSGEDSDSLVDGFTIANGFVAGGYGGAIFCAGASPTITNCIINNNSAEAGGGILTEGGAPSITNCVVTGNSATYGGGIYSSVAPAPSISKCTISANSAYAGGGIMVYSSSPDIGNCAITGNSATYGAGLYYSFAPSSTTLTSCTVTANTASGGGGISCFASTLNIENCILWGNTAGWGSSYGPEMTVGATGYESSVSISYSDVKGGTSYIYVDPGCTLDWDAASNVNIDPLFVQPGYWNGTTWTEGDYHLNPASPCVDAGSISGVPADDIDGDLRPVGASDIGSDEYMDDYQDVPLLLVPDAISITRGGVLGYDVTVINETLSPITFRYWTTVTRPDGNIHPPSGALLGPYEVTLNGSESRSAHLTHRIPGTAPLGTYTYNAYIYGENPIIANEYHFNFDVEAP